MYVNVLMTENIQDRNFFEIPSNKLLQINGGGIFLKEGLILAGIGVAIRYQVTNNKPFEVERCGLFVEIPENESYSRPNINNLKTVAASVHLGRKKRYSFECACESGNAYGKLLKMYSGG